ncbi:MAG TPA: TIGR04282 family arsenosugar biosynthesis glycosyltransferase [Pseudolabrys sp.]|nr:TIGR04282 family arsenosugar biosynthesis glycosyltransferase [Pseudolabrys sp.]
MSPDGIGVAVMAKAPIPGRAKTRLIPEIGAHAAAVLAQRLTERAVATAVAAEVGPVSLWCTPDPAHPAFQALAQQHPVTLWAQPDGDLGARMLACTVRGPTLVIGSDCPALTPAHLLDAAHALGDAHVVLIPAEDGGYVLIGTNNVQPGLFDGMTWGTATVLAETRRRIATIGLRAVELPPLWDVDTESDLARLERELPDLTL